MPVDEGLIQAACDSLEVSVVGTLPDGGQKAVRRVDRAGEDLVLKVVSLGSSEPDALRRAQREVELLKTLSSPHVVQVRSDLLEVGEPVAGVAWLEEYLDGSDLSSIVGAPWTWDDAARLGQEVSLGVGSMHEVKVVHRDLSPGNVRQLSNGSFKVMDPGFARHELRSGLTMGGHPGTHGFASPEHVHTYSGGPTPFSDVFCVGILVYLALTGALPIPVGADTADYLRRLHDVEVIDITDLRDDLSSEQVGLLRACLHSQPARRPMNGVRLAELFGGLR